MVFSVRDVWGTGLAITEENELAAEFAILLRIVLLTALKPSEIFGNEKAIGHGM
jgi:hypothetical protein